MGLSDFTTFSETSVPSGARTRFVGRSLGRIFFCFSLIMLKIGKSERLEKPYRAPGPIQRFIQANTSPYHWIEFLGLSTQ